MNTLRHYNAESFPTGSLEIQVVFRQIQRGEVKEPRGILVMKPRSFVVLLCAFLILSATTFLQAQKIKVIVDQDARGPATTDMQSILIFLQSDKFDVLGITTVSWRPVGERRNAADLAPARNCQQD